MNKRVQSLLIIGLVYAAAITAGAAVLFALKSSIENPVANMLIANVVATIVIFVFSLVFANTSLYDPYWSVMPLFIFIGYYACYQVAFTAKVLLVLIPLVLWGCRLTYNWFTGFEDLHTQDWRYNYLKAKYTKIYPLLAFGGIMLFPTLLISIGTIPLWMIINAPSISGWHIFACIWLVGAISYQTIADLQLKSFRNKNSEDNDCIDRGLWRYSRHPNYFGEVMFWWGLAISAFGGTRGVPVAPSGAYILFLITAIIGAASITLMFVYISIPMMEKHILDTKMNYKTYQKTVPSTLFPYFRDKKASSDAEKAKKLQKQRMQQFGYVGVNDYQGVPQPNMLLLGSPDTVVETDTKLVMDPNTKVVTQVVTQTIRKTTVVDPKTLTGQQTLMLGMGTQSSSNESSQPGYSSLVQSSNTNSFSQSSTNSFSQSGFASQNLSGFTPFNKGGGTSSQSAFSNSSVGESSLVKAHGMSFDSVPSSSYQSSQRVSATSGRKGIGAAVKVVDDDNSSFDSSAQSKSKKKGIGSSVKVVGDDDAKGAFFDSSSAASAWASFSFADLENEVASTIASSNAASSAASSVATGGSSMYNKKGIGASVKVLDDPIVTTSSMRNSKGIRASVMVMDDPLATDTQKSTSSSSTINFGSTGSNKQSNTIHYESSGSKSNTIQYERSAKQYEQSNFGSAVKPNTIQYESANNLNFGSEVKPNTIQYEGGATRKTSTIQYDVDGNQINTTQYESINQNGDRVIEKETIKITHR